MSIIDEDYTGFQELEWMEYAYNYNRWLIKLCEPHIGSEILEIGAGIGTFTGKWSKLSNRLTAVELTSNCVQELRRRFINEKNVEILHMSILDFDPLVHGFFDTAISFNVFEHIENDVKGFQIVSKTLRPGGKFLLFVPACQKLYGNIDKIVGHVRRYEKEELISKLNKARMSVDSIFFVNCVGYFAWFWKAKRSLPGSSISKKDILWYDRIVVPLLRVIEGLVRPPIGQSLFVIARKN